MKPRSAGMSDLFIQEGYYCEIEFFAGGRKPPVREWPMLEEPLEQGWLGQVMRDVRDEVATWPLVLRENLQMTDAQKTLQAARGQKVSEVSVEPSESRKPHKIKTEADTVKELKGLTISTEVDPHYKGEAESEDDDGSEEDRTKSD